jgi:hypothetical protein
MGGNIFTNTRRYDKKEYEELTCEVVGLLANNILTTPDYNNIQIIKSYRTKPSFGDMDIVVNSSLLKPDYIPDIVRAFGLCVGDWSRNGNVVSFNYKRFQIDLIVTKEEEFQSSLDYFAWNDLGNLIGRVMHKVGVKFGHNGSHIIVRDGDYQVGEILITRNIKEILEAFDFDYKQWADGFDTLEEMYEWVSNTRFFNKDIYALENRNHAAKTRDKKRANYSGFLEWCEDREFKYNYPYSTVTSKDGYNIREPFFTEIICKKFPHVLEQYNTLISQMEENREFKSKFNGEAVMRVTGLQDKELGMFMKWAREQIEKTHMRHMFLKYEQHTCDLMISSLHSHYQHGFDWLRVPWELALKISRTEGLVQ